jgi:hypothetical protein
MPHCLLPRYLDGSGLAYLQCSEEVDRRFRFSAIAAKYEELGPWLDSEEGHLAAAGYSHRGDAYRIAIPEKWSSGAWAKVRFTLAKRTPKKTLEVIGHHLNEERIPWLFFTDASGTRLRRIQVIPHHTGPAA